MWHTLKCALFGNIVFIQYVKISSHVSEIKLIRKIFKTFLFATGCVSHPFHSKPLCSANIHTERKKHLYPSATWVFWTVPVSFEKKHIFVVSFINFLHTMLSLPSKPRQPFLIFVWNKRKQSFFITLCDTEEGAVVEIASLYWYRYTPVLLSFISICRVR